MRRGMARALKQSFVRFCMLLLSLLFHGTSLGGESAPLGDCSGRFSLEDSTVKFILQQYVNSTDSAVECRYTFEAPENSGLLVIANDIKAVNDGEIPGCPVNIYDNVDAYGDPVFSLCGHYATLTIPVPSSVALVVCKPEFLGSPYTLTLDLQVVLTGGSNLRACGDSRLSAVSAVPVRYSMGFRADAGSGDASDFCDLNVTSKDSAETLGTNCVLTSDGVCNYEVLAKNGTLAESVDSIDLAAVGGSATVRLHPAGITGVLVSNLPAGFIPLTVLHPPPTAAPPNGMTWNTLSTPVANTSEISTEYVADVILSSSTESATSEDTEMVTDAVDDQTSMAGAAPISPSTRKPSDEDDINNAIVDDCPPTLWKRMTNWFSEAWETVTNSVMSAFRSVGNWFRSWF